MKIIDVEQDSPEWLAWRKTVITATDCPVIMGSSPWSTIYKKWQSKLSIVDEYKTNEAMERGKRLEPIARAQFIERYGINMKPLVVESSEFDFLGASLDGLSDCRKYILEIKCGGENLHNQAREGYIPAYYVDQIQHQLFVTGCEKAFYYSFDGQNGIMLEVLPDPEFEGIFMPKAREFWRCVALNEPPEMQAKDYINRDKDIELMNDLKSIEDLDIAIRELEDRKNAKRKKVIERCEDQSSLCNGKKIMKTIVRGRVDYDAIPELQRVDIDKYRKNSTTVWKIMVA